MDLRFKKKKEKEKNPCKKKKMETVTEQGSGQGLRGRRVAESGSWVCSRGRWEVGEPDSGKHLALSGVQPFTALIRHFNGT